MVKTKVAMHKRMIMILRTASKSAAVTQASAI